jgi:hypothetical protein
LYTINAIASCEDACSFNTRPALIFTGLLLLLYIPFGSLVLSLLAGKKSANISLFDRLRLYGTVQEELEPEERVNVASSGFLVYFARR